MNELSDPFYKTKMNSCSTLYMHLTLSCKSLIRINITDLQSSPDLLLNKEPINN
jgi:hypothetical protein